MVCLDGMAPESGATCFHAGSHDIPDPEARHQKLNRTWPLPDDARASTLCCKPGQIVAIHPKVLHGGGMNTSAGMRRNVILQVGRPGAEVVTDNQESLTGTLLKRTGARTPV
jgi:ectoine hydroxylase-related dioxygenase (phytanoyl-CoA dioxygenase family)